MNEEIKEILDNLKKYETRYKLYNETQFIITYREIIILLDYINNLKETPNKIKFYIEQNDIKNMLWGKEILEIIGGNDD